MTTPATQISASDVNTENLLSATSQVSFDDTAFRALAGIPTPGTAISMANMRSKTNSKNLRYTAPKQNANLVNDFPGVPTSSEWVVYIDPGVYIWSDSTTLPALTTGGSFPAGLKIVNQGYIMGRGGDGGSGAVGAVGGDAISLTNPVTIDNTNPAAYIGAGGGGGGGSSSPNGRSGGGGGAGGGRGGAAVRTATPGPFTGTGASGGAIGNVGNAGDGYIRDSFFTAARTGGAGGGAGGGGGANQEGGGATGPFWHVTLSGGGGGRIFAGTGGAGGSTPAPTATVGPGGAGGAGNAVGISNPLGGGGGGWGAAGGNGAFAGGAGGKAILSNGHIVNFVNNDTTRVYGTILSGFYISSPQQQLNLATYLTGQGWNGTSEARVTIDPGVYLWSDSTAAAALTTGGPYPAGLTIANNGYIMGKGGAGGGAGGAGGAGGTAISIGSAAVTLLNSASGWIGGGGGGAGGSISPPNQHFLGGGGGAGGGAGGNGGPAGGAIGTAATMGTGSPTAVGNKNGAGGQGTRRFVLNEMAGGGGGYSTFSGYTTPVGGTNNAAGATGTDFNPQGGPPRMSAGGGGGWGASGGGGGGYFGGGRGAGAAGGKAIALNGRTITQTNSGTIWGAIS